MIRVFAVTGTNGKTTVSWMLRSILEQKKPCALIGTIEHIIGKFHYEAVNTTPGPRELSSMMKEMEQQGTGQCVMEVSSHGISQGRVEAIDFFCCGFTSLSRDHMDYHGTMEAYYLTKKQLFLGNNIKAVICIDDAYGKRLYRELTAEGRTGIFSCSIKNRKADFYGEILKEDITGTEIRFHRKGKAAGCFKVPFPGTHFGEDGVLAAAMASIGGAEFCHIKNGLGQLKTVPGRMEMTGCVNDTLGVIDYAHTPDSLQRLLEALGKLKKGKLICVFGCGGFRDKGKRRLMGCIAGMLSDYVIITNDNPRGEPPENIAEAIEEGVHSAGCSYTVILNRYEAIKRAVSLAGKWDIVAVAGKGHEKYQISAGGRTAFDDKTVLKELLEKKYEKTYDETNWGSYRR